VAGVFRCLLGAQEQNNEVARNMSQRRIRIGIVGCGEVTQIMHWPSLQQLADCYEVVALCDISPIVLESLGKQWNIGILTTDHRELVNCNEVEAVLVANPNAFHAEVTVAAIAAGKHALVEKPMCMNRREAEQIVTAQKKQPRTSTSRVHATLRAGFSRCVQSRKRNGRHSICTCP
jgi:predicted dehydrogenase